MRRNNVTHFVGIVMAVLGSGLDTVWRLISNGSSYRPFASVVSVKLIHRFSLGNHLGQCHLWRVVPGSLAAHLPAGNSIYCSPARNDATRPSTKKKSGILLGENRRCPGTPGYLFI